MLFILLVLFLSFFLFCLYVGVFVWLADWDVRCYLNDYLIAHYFSTMMIIIHRHAMSILRFYFIHHFLFFFHGATCVNLCNNITYQERRVMCDSHQIQLKITNRMVMVMGPCNLVYCGTFFSVFDFAPKNKWKWIKWKSLSNSMTLQNDVCM